MYVCHYKTSVFSKHEQEQLFLVIPESSQDTKWKEEAFLVSCKGKKMEALFPPPNRKQE